MSATRSRLRRTLSVGLPVTPLRNTLIHFDLGPNGPQTCGCAWETSFGRLPARCGADARFQEAGVMPVVVGGRREAVWRVWRLEGGKLIFAFKRARGFLSGALELRERGRGSVASREIDEWDQRNGVAAVK